MNLNFDDIPDDPSLPMPILPGHVSAGRLERVLRAGAFAVTSEMDPPDSDDPGEVFARAHIFDGYVDAINATDGAGAHCHMSSAAVSALLIRAGYAPIMQIACRDKNRIAIQGDILGGAANQQAEGRKLCVELIQEIREIKGVNGVHVMAYYQQEAVAAVIERSGVLQGRAPWYPGIRKKSTRVKIPCNDCNTATNHQEQNP